MRLGEIKQKLDSVVDESNKIIIEQETIFGGQAYRINNFREISDVYFILVSLDWNDADDSQINPVISKYDDNPNPVQIDQAEFNALNTYISALNQKLPFFYSILDVMTEEQDEKVINIKLPEDVTSFDELKELNKRIEDTLKFFNVDGEFIFSGFDKGSDWYVVCAQGILTSSFFISCLKIAQEVMKLRAEYFKSEEARISYEVSKKQTEKASQVDFENQWIEIYIESKIKDVMEKIGKTNGASQAELQGKLLRGVKAIVKELGEGTEFHLSLTPPSYVTETDGGLHIDYKQIQQIRAEEAKKIEEDKPKTIEATVSEISDEKKDEK